MRNKWRHVCVDHSSNFERDLLLPLLGDRYNQVIEYAAKAILAADIKNGYASDSWDNGADKEWLKSNAAAALAAVLPALVVEFRATALEAQQ